MRHIGGNGSWVDGVAITFLTCSVMMVLRGGGGFFFSCSQSLDLLVVAGKPYLWRQLKDAPQKIKHDSQITCKCPPNDQVLGRSNCIDHGRTHDSHSSARLAVVEFLYCLPLHSHPVGIGV